MVYLFLLLGFSMLIIGTNFIVNNGNRILLQKNHNRDIILKIDIPFLASVIACSVLGNSELLFGLMTGSILFYILAVCGVCSMIQDISVKRSFYLRELSFAIFSEVMFLFLAADYLLHGKHAFNQISRWDGILLILIFFLYCFSFLIQKKRQISEEGSEKEEKKNPFQKEKKENHILSFLGILLGVIFVLFGAYFLVKYASQLASLLMLRQNIVGMTLVTIGVSIPGLAEIISIRKEEKDTAIDCLVTAVIVNILLAMGIAAVIRPIIIGTYHVQDIIFLYIGSLLLWIFTYRRNKLNRLEGCILVSIYIVYIFYVCIR